MINELGIVTFNANSDLTNFLQNKLIIFEFLKYLREKLLIIRTRFYSNFT